MNKILVSLSAMFLLSAATAFADVSAGVPDDHGPGHDHCRARLEIVKTGPGSALSGTDGVYRIEVRNTGNCDLRDIIVTDRLSAHTTFDHAWPNPSSFAPDVGPFGGLVKWQGVDLRAGERAEFRVRVDFITDRPHIAIDTSCAFHERLFSPACDSAQTTITPTGPYDSDLPITRG